MLKVYYAHPLSLYGTLQEKRDIQLLLNLGLDVLNPNEQQHQEGYKKEKMEYFRKIVRACDVFAFRAFPDGKIGAGIIKELEFFGTDKPIVELPHSISCRILTVEQTRDYLKQLGQR